MTSVWSTETSSKVDSIPPWNPVNGGAAMTSSNNKVADIPSTLEPTQFPLGFLLFAAFKFF